MIYLLLTWLFAPLLWWRAARRKHIRTGRLLVIQTAKIGDFVATTPVFRILKKQRPQLEIVALLHPVNVPLAERLDCIDRIVALPARGFKGWAGKRWLFERVAEGYDGVLLLSPNLAALLAPFWAGVPHRVAVLPDRRQGIARLTWPFLTHGERHVAGRLFRESAMRALSGLGLTIDATALQQPPEIALTDTGKKKAGKTLRNAQPPFVGLGLGAGNRMKALELDQLVTLANGLLERTPATLVLIGTAEDKTAAASLHARLPQERLVDTTGQCSLVELPSLLAALDCFVGVDSGATYLADAVGVPVVDFMGPADADDQRPIGRHAFILRSTEPCAPCSHTFDAPYNCPLGTRACIANLPIPAVVAAVVEIQASRNSVAECRR